MDERESSDLYRVRKTLCQMLDDRGYVIEEDDLTMSLADFKELFTGDNGKISRERCQITACKESDTADQVRGARPASADAISSLVTCARFVGPDTSRRADFCVLSGS